MTEPCIASWEAVEELGDNCPLCGRACYTHELEDDRAARLAHADAESRRAFDEDRPPYVCDWNSEPHRFCGGSNRRPAFDEER